MKNDIIACVVRAHGILVGERDLSPGNERINEALSALVRAVLAGCPPGDVGAVLNDPGIRAMRCELLQKLAVAEGEMERSWARAFGLRARLCAADFQDFTYWDCYHHLVRAELRGLALACAPGKGESIAFVGAGPLPLSAIIMHIDTGMHVTCIDIDPLACRLARELCRKAGLAGIAVECARGAHYDYARSPIVFVASLVPDKGKVMWCIRRTCPHAVVALRSAEGLRTLLYEPVDETELSAMGCGYLGRTGYDPAVINTTLFYEAVPRGDSSRVRTAL